MNEFYSYDFNVGSTHFYMGAICKDEEVESFKDMTFPWLSSKSLEIYEQTFKYLFADEYSMYDKEFAKENKIDDNISINYAFYNNDSRSTYSKLPNGWSQDTDYYYMTSYSTNPINKSSFSNSLYSQVDSKSLYKKFETLLATDEKVAQLFKASLNRYIHFKEQERFEKIQLECASVKKIEKMGKNYKVNFDDIFAN